MINRLRPALRRHFTISPETFYFETVHSYFFPRAVFTAIDICLADKLTGTMSVADLARATGTVPERTERLMKYLAVHGVFERVSPGVYRHNEMSELLREENARGRYAGIEFMRAIVSKAQEGWKSALKGEVAIPFHQSFGNLTMWEFFSLPENKALKEIFDRTKVSLTATGVESILSTYPWQRHANATVMDVGGTLGRLLSALLQQHPTFRGCVYGQPQTAEAVESFWRENHAEEMQRFQFQAGSFFQSVPTGGDVYILKYILHDWKDEDCVRILRNVVEAMRRTKQTDASKSPCLLVIEKVYDFPPRTPEVAEFDMTMFSLFAAKERSTAEFRQLFSASGLEMTEKWDTATDLSIIRCEVRS